MLTIRTLGKFQIRNEDTISENDKFTGVSDSSQKSDTDVL
jgi:hypothetical protein